MVWYNPLMTTAQFHGHSGIGIDMGAVFSQLRGMGGGIGRIVPLYRTRRKFSKIASLAEYMRIDEMDDAEELLLFIDDAIDEIEADIKKSDPISAFLLKGILSDLLTIQFTLSNKLADTAIENRV